MPNQLKTTVESVKRGETLVLIDDVANSTSGYLIRRANDISEAQVSQIINLARGVICAAITSEGAELLGLGQMNNQVSSPAQSFTVSVEAREGVTTGISAADRAKTLRTLAETKNPKLDLVTPGHIFPVKAKSGGVLVRSGIAEAAVDLMALSEQISVACFCHCLGEDGELLDQDGLIELSEQHSLPRIRISEIIRHRLATEELITKVTEAELPTDHGNFRAICFKSIIDDAEHLALIKGELNREANSAGILVRVQAENKIDDLFGVAKKGGRKNINTALKAIEQEGRGIFLYLRHSRKGLLSNQMERFSAGKPRLNRAYQFREFGIGAQILSYLGAKRIKLLSNSDGEISGIENFDIEIVDKVSLS